MNAENQQPAVACSLSSPDYQTRIRRFANLNHDLLLDSRTLELGLELTYSLNAADELRELVRLEEECCPFLRFRLEPGPASIKLSILVPESARESVNALLQPFRPS